MSPKGRPEGEYRSAQHEGTPVSWLEALAERRIEEARAAGVFDDLPGAGRPLVLDDDLAVPPELRAAWRVLRNAGYAPPEVALLRERAELVALLATLEDEPARRRAAVRLAMLQAVMEARGGVAAAGSALYRERIAARFGGGGGG